jgi:hypothetical protein
MTKHKGASLILMAVWILLQSGSGYGNTCIECRSQGFDNETGLNGVACKDPWDPDRTDQVSISPTFYACLFLTKVLCAEFLYLKFGFVIFWQQNISAKAARKMLMKIDNIGVNFNNILQEAFSSETGF